MASSRISQATPGVMLDALRLSSQPRDGGLIVVIEGDLDIVTSRQLDDCLARARRGHSTVILDMSAVDFMDTSSLAVIVDHWKKLTAAGGTLALAGARYRYTRTLWITGLAHRLPRFDTVEDAAKALLAGSGGSQGSGASAS
jgi:anti-sigma B factor antagonist